MAAEVSVARERGARSINGVRPNTSRTRYVGKVPVPRDVNQIPDREWNSITRILSKKDPESIDAPRYLEREAMDNRSLGKFYAVAEHFMTRYSISESARERVRKWHKLAWEEVVSR